MKEYPKIQSVYKRDPRNNYRTFLEGEYSTDEIEYLKNNQWIFTEKIDGTNIRVIYHNRQDNPAEVSWIELSGRSEKSVVPNYLQNALFDIFNDVSKFEVFTEDVCLYGEGYGKKIQKGGERYREDISFVLFDVKIRDYWIDRMGVEMIAKGLGVDVVPILGSGRLSKAISMCRQGFMSKWGNFEAEGLVCKPKYELRDRSGKRVITKIKCKDFKQ